MSEKQNEDLGVKTTLILTSVLFLLVGTIIGVHLSIGQIESSHIFEDMAEGMTCESLKDTYQEDPKHTYGLPNDESSWWYVGVEGNDAMGEEIIKRCTIDEN